MGRVRNLRIGWVKSMERGAGDYLSRRLKYILKDCYAFNNVVTYFKMNNPWVDRGKKKKGKDKEYEKLRTKIICIFI